MDVGVFLNTLENHAGATFCVVVVLLFLIEGVGDAIAGIVRAFRGKR